MRRRLSDLTALVAGILLGAWPLRAQIVDQVIVFTRDTAGFDHVARFSRQLQLLGTTQVTLAGAGNGVLGGVVGTSVDAQGQYWIPFDPLNDTKVLRVTSGGDLILPSVNLQHNPVFLTTTLVGTTFVLTRIPLLAPAPLYGVSPSGFLLGSSFACPQLFSFYTELIEVTPGGEIWIGGEGPKQPSGFLPQLVRVNPTSGGVIDQKLYPNPDGSPASAAMLSLAADAQGVLWSIFQPGYLTEIVGGDIVQQKPLTTESYGHVLKIDAQGNLYVLALATPSPFATHKILRIDPASLTVAAEYPLNGLASDFGGGLAIGAAGEDLFVSGGGPAPNYPARLWRINLVTGVKSSLTLAELGTMWEVPAGDPTGFIWANVKDQQGDADGDGAANRTETLAGSNPFDATSRPEGPKVFVSFAPTTNVLILTWIDPDGLLDPQGGLDLSTLSVSIGNFGNVFWFLVPFATALDLSPDGKKATLTFGALPLPFDKKWEVEATIADLTGATGWDWQVTPPGDL